MRHEVLPNHMVQNDLFFRAFQLFEEDVGNMKFYRVNLYLVSTTVFIFP